MKSPFKFLDAFTPADKAVFFGREEETEALYSMVFKTPLLMVYGLSGAGKTSLVQCGLAGRFDGTDWYPFFLRRNNNINTSLEETLAKAMPEGETLRPELSENVSLLFRYYLRPVYLIFDQLEELFILGDSNEQEQFARQLNGLIASELPCKILLIIREEFIGQLYALEKIIPTLYDYRLRVEQMGFKKVNTVVGQSCQSFNIRLEAPESDVQLIYDNLSAGRSGVQLPYLQVYLDMLYREDFSRTYPNTNVLPDSLPPLKFTTAEIRKFGKIEDVLGRFLGEQVESLRKGLVIQFKDLPENTVARILDVFVTEQGTKRPVGYSLKGEEIHFEEDISRILAGLPHQAIHQICSQLITARLLRQTDETLELAHDALAQLIDNGRSDQERRQNEVFNRLVTNFKEFEETGEYLTRRQLSALEDYLPLIGDRLSPEVKQFIARSAHNAEENEQIALAAERRKRKQTVRIAVIGFALASIAFVAALVATLQYRAASKARTAIAMTAFDNQVKVAETFKLQGQYAEALNQLEKARPYLSVAKAGMTMQFDSLGKNWTQIQQYVELGDSLKLNSDLRGALTQFDKAEALGKDRHLKDLVNQTQKDLDQSFADNWERGQRMLSAGQYQLAVTYFEKCTVLKPDNQAAVEKLQSVKILINR